MAQRSGRVLTGVYVRHSPGSEPYRHAWWDVYPLEQRDRMIALVAASKCFQQLSMLDELQDFALDVAVRYPDHSEIQRFVEEIAGVE